MDAGISINGKDLPLLRNHILRYFEFRQEKSKGASRTNTDPSESSSEHRTDTSQDETMSFRPLMDVLDDV